MKDKINSIGGFLLITLVELRASLVITDNVTRFGCFLRKSLTSFMVMYGVYSLLSIS